MRGICAKLAKASAKGHRQNFVNQAQTHIHDPSLAFAVAPATTTLRESNTARLKGLWSRKAILWTRLWLLRNRRSSEGLLRQRKVSVCRDQKADERGGRPLSSLGPSLRSRRFSPEPF